MPSTKPAMQTVAEFYEAIGRKDMKRLRGLLTSDFTFSGPMMVASSPDEFVTAMTQMPFEATVSGSRFIAENGRVAHAFVWSMTAPTKADIPMCEILATSGGKIKSSELYYDARLFPKPPEGAKA